MKKLALLTLAITLNAHAQQGGAAPVALTIYNQDFAVARTTVDLNLTAGPNEITTTNVTSQLEPDSVVLRDPTNRTPFKVTEQNYDAGVIGEALRARRGPSPVRLPSFAVPSSRTRSRWTVLQSGREPDRHDHRRPTGWEDPGRRSFTGLGGATGTTTRNHIGRLNADGTVDASFNPARTAQVHAVAVQPDGKILAGGNFTSVGGGTGLTTARSHIARFNADGTVDSTFNPGASLNVYALAVQPDGKILVGGNFSTLGGGGTGVTTRIGSGGSTPTARSTRFNPGASKIRLGAPPVYTIAVQPDGKIVVGGYFNGLGGGTGTTTRNFIGRLNADGSVDTLQSRRQLHQRRQRAGDPGRREDRGRRLLHRLGSDRRDPARNIGRLNADGSVDVGFNPGAETQVLTLAVQTDGKILAGGYFKRLGRAEPPGSMRNYIGRLDANGALDGTFNPGANNVVNAVAMQADGAIVAGGLFLTLGNGTG